MRLFLIISIAACTFACGRLSDASRGNNNYLTILTSKNLTSSDALSVSKSIFTKEGMSDWHLKAGDEVMYAASYGLGGEAGQAFGTLVEDGDGLYFQQQDNTTTQLLLAPGMPLNANSKHSLWEFKAYFGYLKNLLAANASVEKSKYSIYDSSELSLVSFNAGTAGKEIFYQEAYQLKLHWKGVGNVRSNLAVYIAPTEGPVALEFQENGITSGTFKVYFNRKK